MKDCLQESLRSRLREFIWKYQLVKLFKFLLAGLPSFLIAVPLNWWLVSRLGVDKALGYALVLVMQVTINFFMCRAFVFVHEKEQNIFRQYFHFVAGILTCRIADWGVYVVLTEYAGFYYLLVQVMNIVIFSILKFKFSQKAIEGKR